MYGYYIKYICYIHLACPATWRVFLSTENVTCNRWYNWVRFSALHYTLCRVHEQKLQFTQIACCI